MKKTVLVILILSVLICCGPKQEEVDRIMEDGVEVVINHLEPYRIEGEPDSLILEEEYILDLERDDLAEIGIKDIFGFDVDSEGFIYFWSFDAPENFIFKFDKSGNFVKSFGRKGQGPGEIEGLSYLWINNSDIVAVADDRRRKILLFSTEGELCKEIDFGQGFFVGIQLDNKNILEMRNIFKPETGYAYLPIILSNEDLEEIKELQKGQKIPNWIRAPEINGLHTTPNLNVWSISKEQIFISNLESGYEFLVYDFNGQLLRKIRKEYSPMEVPQDIKDTMMKVFDQPRLEKYKVKEKVFFPDYMPPFQYFFTDNESRLFVMTCENGQRHNEYIYDIFNPDGFFIARTSLGNFGNSPYSAIPIPLPSVAKNKRLYHLRTKESGYQELVVYKMDWE